MTSPTTRAHFSRGRCGCSPVLDLDTDEHPVERVHRRLGELLGVHLAEPLEAADLDPFLRELERLLAKLGEACDVPRLLAEREVERRAADDLDQPAVRL